MISAISNLRARNYQIKEVTPFKVKIIAGKIIPALATTTAMVVGAVGVEIIKYLLGKKIDDMRNSFMNLALPLWLFSEPLPPNQTKDKDYDPVAMGPVKAFPPNYTIWDKLQVNGPMSVQQFVDHFQNEYKLKASIVAVGQICLYNSYMDNPPERMNMDVAKAVEELQKKQIPDYKTFLEIEVSAEDEEGVDVTMPTVKYAFKGL